MKYLSFFYKASVYVISQCIILSMYSCSGYSGQRSNDVKIDMLEAVKNPVSVKLSEVASSVEYIPLELKDSAYLYAGMNILATDDSYVFQSTNKSVNVAFHEFDKNGKYMRSVGSKGRAKGEFVSPKGLCYNSVTKDYALLDQNKLIIYGPDGSFKTENTVIKFRSMGFPRIFCESGKYIINAIVVDDLQSMIRGEMKDLLIELDSDANILRKIEFSQTVTKAVGTPGGNRGMSGNGMTLYANDGIFRIYRENGTDTIKCLDPQTLEPNGYYLLDGYGKGVLMNKFSYLENDSYIFMLIMKNRVFFPQAQEWDMKNYALYDKRNGSMRALPNNERALLSGFENDLDNCDSSNKRGVPFWPSYIKGNKMYQLIGAEEFVEMASSSGSACVKEIAAGLNSESNPVLMVVTLK